LELGWLHALGGPHWISLAGAARLDSSDRAKVTGESCEGTCPRAGVFGGELAVGYRFAPRFHRKAWLVPEVHGEVVGGAWRYGEGLGISPTLTVDLGLRVGAGLRVYVTQRVGLGADVAVQADLLLHQPDGSRPPDFGLGLALFPVVLEIRR
jgi:hypothetical protein